MWSIYELKNEEFEQMKENIYLLLAPLLSFNLIISKLKDVFCSFWKENKWVSFAQCMCS